MEASPFPLTLESRLTASKSAAHFKTFDVCSFEHRTGGTELPPAAWYWEDQCWLECRARASLTFPSPAYHQERPFQGGTSKKPPADEHMTKASSVLHSQTCSVCISSLSLVSSPSVNSGICWHLLELPFLLLP